MESPFRGDILKGKVALLTGGGSGIGYEISRQLGKHGASIAIMGRRRQVLDAAVSSLHSLGIPVIFFSHFSTISLPFQITCLPGFLSLSLFFLCVSSLSRVDGDFSFKMKIHPFNFVQ